MELTFRAGDELIVLSRTSPQGEPSEWWKGYLARPPPPVPGQPPLPPAAYQRVGMFPGNHVELVPVGPAAPPALPAPAPASAPPAAATPTAAPARTPALTPAPAAATVVTGVGAVPASPATPRPLKAALPTTPLRGTPTTARRAYVPLAASPAASRSPLPRGGGGASAN